MPLPLLVALVLVALLLCVAEGSAQNNAAADQHAAIGVKTTAQNFQRTTHPDAQWFPEAGLGLFIHWGISSVHGGVDLSWGMMAEKPWDPRDTQTITPAAYFKLAESFNPTLYDPDKWLRAAKAAGFRYVVMTTKHHDGYAMWPSAYGDFGVKQFLPGVDLVKGYVEACRKNGLKCGLYYSPPDWHFNRQYMSFHYGSADQKRFPGREHYDLDHHVMATIPSPPADWDAKYRAYVRGQVTELLTNYGKIDIIWFDGGPDALRVDEIRALQPGILINPRMHGYGDFQTPECHFPDTPLTGWWEMCDIWHHAGWGYQKSAETYKPLSWVLTMLARVRSWGGNFLPNVGPRPTGEMPDAYYTQMGQIADWMAVNSEAVFGVKGGPLPPKANVPVTVRDKTWYAFLLPKSSEPVVLSEVGEPKAVTMLGRDQELVYSLEGGKLIVDVPATMRTELVDVVKIEW